MLVIRDVCVFTQARAGGEQEGAEIASNAKPPGVVALAAERQANQNDEHEIERDADGEVAHLMEVAQRRGGHEVELDDRVQHRVRRVQFVGQQKEKDQKRDDHQRVGDGSVQTGFSGFHLENGERERGI